MEKKECDCGATIYPDENICWYCKQRELVNKELEKRDENRIN